jgi:hypothetical protein
MRLGTSARGFYREFRMNRMNRIYRIGLMYRKNRKRGMRSRKAWPETISAPRAG